MTKNKELISVATNEYCNTPLRIKCAQLFIKILFQAIRILYAAIYTVPLYHLVKGNL